jgi:hypothetical protein
MWNWLNWKQLLAWLLQGFFMTLGYMIASAAVPWILAKI